MAKTVIVFLLRGISACRLPWHGSSWVSAPTLERFAAQSKVFDNHLSNSIIPDECDKALFPSKLLETLISNRTELFWLCDKESVSPCKTFLRIICDLNNSSEWLAHLSKCLQGSSQKSKLIVIELRHGLPPWKLTSNECSTFFPYLERNKAEDDEEINPERSKKELNIDVEDEFIHAQPWDKNLPEYVDPDDDLTHLRLIETQAAKLFGLDEFIKPMFDSLTSNIGVLVIGDRGLEVGDRSVLGAENPLPWFTRIHVPCVWYDPYQDLCPQRVVSFTCHGDIAATLGNYLVGRAVIEAPANSIDLFEVAQADRNGPVDRFIISSGINGALSIRVPEWSLMVANEKEPMLFKIPQDKWEVLNLASQHSEIIEQITALMNANK